MDKSLIIDSMLIVDSTGNIIAPSIRQLLNKDMRVLYQRDKTKDKTRYIQECIVIYYLGDPKSPANQSGLSEKEALFMAIDQAGLEPTYIPDALVQNLIKQYYLENITEAGKVVENLQKGIHNINKAIEVINTFLNDALSQRPTLEDLPNILTLIDNVNKKAGDVPGMIKKLEEAKTNLMYEQETKSARGGVIMTSSMNAEDES